MRSKVDTSQLNLAAARTRSKRTLETHDFVRFLVADGELAVGSSSNVEVVDVVGVQQRQSEGVDQAALLTESDDERPVTAARPDHRLSRPS